MCLRDIKSLSCFPQSKCFREGLMGRQVTEMESKAQDYTAALLSCVLTLYIFCIKKNQETLKEMIPILGKSITWKELRTIVIGLREIDFTKWLRIMFGHFPGQAEWSPSKLLSRERSRGWWISGFQHSIWGSWRDSWEACAAAVAHVCGPGS